MKPELIRLTKLVALLVIVGSGPAYAGCGHEPSKLTRIQMNTVLRGNYACGQSAALNAPGWNEQHTASPGSPLIEQHEGGNTKETVGTWATSVSGSKGRVTYGYTGGVGPVYEIAVVDDINCTNNAACTMLPQTYQFCGVGGGAPAVLSIKVTTTSIAPPLSNCPANP